jgi:phosphatidylethanolamine N-methyltransferase
MVESFLVPGSWSLVDITVLSAALIYFSTLFYDLPVWFHAVMFLFWRIMYNGGLGFVLYMQSNHRMFTTVYGSIDKNSPTFRFIHYLVQAKLGKKHKMEDFPDDFNAWVLYQHLVNVVLASDSLCYFVLVLKCWEFPSLSFTYLVSFLLGVGLIVFNYYAKVDAHRVIGQYAWYWGDFFFSVKQDLTFNGIFELFPHPMYTVGYSAYYGISLITQSYTVLYLSLVAHLLQMLFLIYVEEPHIEKMYGSDTAKDPTIMAALYNEDSGYFNKQRDVFIIKNLDPFRPEDLMLVIILLYQVILYFADLHWAFYVGQSVISQIIYSFGMGFVLYRQSTEKWFTKHFTSRGYSRRDAFESWKRIYNACQTINVVIFFICARKLYNLPDNWGFFAQQTLGFGLVALSLWAMYSSLDVLGDYGWFYADFFIPDVRLPLSYGGIYRFLNNPEAVVGYAGYYGLAVISNSTIVFLLALFAHGCHFVFVRYVETPHMKRIYGKKLRDDGGIGKAVSKSLQNVRSKAKKIISEHGPVSPKKSQ